MRGGFILKVRQMKYLLIALYYRQLSANSKKIKIIVGNQIGIDFMILFYYPLKIVCNTIQYMIFQFVLKL